MALELGDTTIDHRGNHYRLAGGPPEWAVTREGILLGHLVIMSSAGEEGEPVYTTRLPDGTAGDLEGTDWDQVLRGMLNAVDPAIDPAGSNVARDGA
jgi:hypothetical protein